MRAACARKAGFPALRKAARRLPRLRGGGAHLLDGSLPPPRTSPARSGRRTRSTRGAASGRPPAPGRGRTRCSRGSGGGKGGAGGLGRGACFGARSSGGPDEGDTPLQVESGPRNTVLGTALGASCARGCPNPWVIGRWETGRRATRPRCAPMRRLAGNLSHGAQLHGAATLLRCAPSLACYCRALM